jgi:hypothetical protein
MSETKERKLFLIPVIQPGMVLVAAESVEDAIRSMRKGQFNPQDILLWTREAIETKPVPTPETSVFGFDDMDGELKSVTISEVREISGESAEEGFALLERQGADFSLITARSLWKGMKESLDAGDKDKAAA